MITNLGTVVATSTQSGEFIAYIATLLNIAPRGHGQIKHFVVVGTKFGEGSGDHLR